MGKKTRKPSEPAQDFDILALAKKYQSALVAGGVVVGLLVAFSFIKPMLDGATRSPTRTPRPAVTREDESPSEFERRVSSLRSHESFDQVQAFAEESGELEAWDPIASFGTDRLRSDEHLEAAAAFEEDFAADAATETEAAASTQAAEDDGLAERRKRLIEPSEEVAAAVREAIIEGAKAAAGLEVFYPMGASASRGVLVSADSSGITVRDRGQNLTLPWALWDIRRQAALALRLAADDEQRYTVALFLAQNKLFEESNRALDDTMFADAEVARKADFLRSAFPRPEVSLAWMREQSRQTTTPAATAVRTVEPTQDERTWRALGPGGGGAMYVPTISPLDPKVAFVISDMGAAYFTQDGGRKWRTVPRLFYAHHSAFSSTDPNVYYAAFSPGLHRSNDRGETWQRVTRVRQYPTCSAWRVIVDPDDGSYVWVTFGVSLEVENPLRPGNTMIVERSSNDGAAFSEGRGFPSGHGMVYNLAVDRASPVGNRTLYAATTDGFYRSRDGGANWSKSGRGLPSRGLWGVATLFDRRTMRSTILVSGIPGGVFRSEDGGETFTPSGEGLPGNAVIEGIATSSDDPNMAYIAGSVAAVSSDGGKTWKHVWPNAKKHGGWLFLFRPWRHDKTRSVGVDPNNPRRAWWSGDMALFSTEDGGQTLTEINSHPMPQDAQRHTFDGNAPARGFYMRMNTPGVVSNYDGGGLEVTLIYQVIANPYKRGVFYANYADIGSFRTEDGGKSWKYNLGAWNTGIKSQWRNSCYDIAIDRTNPDVLWAVLSGYHNFPMNDLERGSQFNVGGLAVSRDGGDKWQPLENVGLPDRLTTSVILDRRDQTHIYVAVYGEGIFRSTDNGRSFHPFSRGLPDNPLVWRLRQGADGTVYLICNKARPGGIWRLDDRTQTWTRLDGAPAAIFTCVRDVIVGEGRLSPKMVAVAVNYGTAAGVHLSVDGGATWQHLLRRDGISSVAVSPDGMNWYAVGNSGFMYSVDGGASWTEDTTFPFRHRNQSVVLNPHDPSEVWVGSGGCGVLMRKF